MNTDEGEMGPIVCEKRFPLRLRRAQMVFDEHKLSHENNLKRLK